MDSQLLAPKPQNCIVDDFAHFLNQVGGEWALDRLTREEFEAKASHYRQNRNQGSSFKAAPNSRNSGGGNGRNPGRGSNGKENHGKKDGGGFDDFLHGVGNGGVIL